MMVTSKTFYSVYDRNNTEVKLFLKGHVYEAEKELHGYIVVSENGQQNFFSKECFKRMFTIHEPDYI